ncbi:hypothetical protein VUR80DRAFT_8888 [Thermomyces stellatus]
MDSARSLHSKPSEETLASLLQLDPSPIADSPTANMDKPLSRSPQDADFEECGAKPADAETTPRRGTTGPISFLSRVQRYSSITFSIFTSIHFANTSLIPLLTRSVPASETYLLQARELYQTSLSEPLLVAAPAVAHVSSGLALRLLRRSQNARRYANDAPAGGRSNMRIWPHVSWISVSGYAFTVFFAAHVTLNRVVPLMVEGDSSDIGLAYVAHGFARHTVISSLGYVGLLAAGCGHMVWGAAKWLGIAPPSPSRGDAYQVVDPRMEKSRRRVWLGINATSAAVALFWAAGGLGVVARGGLSPGWIGKLYDGLFASVGL